MTWTIDGIPLHPLLVHGAVVLIAVNSLALIGALLIKRFRVWLGWGLPLVGAVSAVTAFLTKEAGEKMLKGFPAEGTALADHTHWGGLAGVWGMVLGATTVIAWLTWSPFVLAKAPWLAHPSGRIVVLIVGVGIAIAATTLDILAGHSGATSVWELR